MPPGHPKGDCRINKFTYCYVGNKHRDCGLVYTHNSCVCNDEMALKHRHQVATPKVVACTENLLKHFKIFEKLYFKTDLLSTQEVVNNYQGRWRRRYEQARVSLNDRPLCAKDFILNWFTKPDKEVKLEDLGVPRGIQYRNARAALMMGRFTHAVEGEIYKLEDEYKTKVFGKGVNLHDLAADFKKKVANFHNPVFLELDASKFDAHVSVDMLRVTRNLYMRLCRTPKDRQLVGYLWSRTFTNFGYTRNGIKYKTWGTRMSGDMDTGLGNCIVMYLLLCEYMKVVEIDKFSLSVNGDDSVIIIEYGDLEKAKDISMFKDYGFKMKFQVSFALSEMEYCQCKLVETAYGPVMARSPKRILDRGGWSVTKFGKSRLKDYLLSLGCGEMAINYGLPIGYVLGKLLKQAGYGGKMMPVDRKRYISYTRQKYWQCDEEAVITPEARLSYFHAFGISPDEQIRIEESLKIINTRLIESKLVDIYYTLLQIEPVMG